MTMMMTFVIHKHTQDSIKGGPIYSVDSRNYPLTNGRHFSVLESFATRASFDVTSRPSMLTIDPVNQEDAGEFRCRVSDSSDTCLLVLRVVHEFGSRITDSRPFIIIQLSQLQNDIAKNIKFNSNKRVIFQVDFRKGRTSTSVVMLNVIGKLRLSDC